MIKRMLTGIAAACVVMLVATTPVAAQDAVCSHCGPGDHWVETCGAGQDRVIDHGAVVGIDTTLDCNPESSIILRCCSPANPLVINRSDPLDDSTNFPGLRPVDGHLDVIDTQMVYMCLTGGGITLVAGDGEGQGGVLAETLGAIAEIPGDPALAESFFEVYFEVDLGGRDYVYNHDPLIIQVDEINCVPPRARYIHPTGCLALYTDPVGGTHVADHRLYRIPTVSEWGLIVLTLLLLTAGAVVLGRRREAIDD